MRLLYYGCSFFPLHNFIFIHKFIKITSRPNVRTTSVYTIMVSVALAGLWMFFNHTDRKKWTKIAISMKMC